LKSWRVLAPAFPLSEADLRFLCFRWRLIAADVDAALLEYVLGQGVDVVVPVHDLGDPRVH